MTAPSPDPNNYSSIYFLFVNVGIALLAATFTHWMDRRKERVTNCERLLSYLNLVKIDLSINADRTQSDGTDYFIDGIRTFLKQGDVGAVDKTFLVLLVKLALVMDLFNQSSDMSNEKSRINQLQNLCVNTANKQLAIGVGSKNDVPGGLKPKIDEGFHLLTGEIKRQEQLRDCYTLSWISWII